MPHLPRRDSESFYGPSPLARYAVHNDASLGRRYPEAEPRFRGPFQRDRDRIIHSTAFRRLEYKTQVFVNHEGDLFRTRLTHSIEVSQIARTIARALGVNEDLAEAVALAHDLGHTPFGHAGQDALNGRMREFGGFEHNQQSLRVVDELEEKYAEFPGLNLSFETREGILKHCSVKDARELGAVGLRFVEKTHPSLEAQLTNLGDEIAYNSHDVDDGLRAGLIGVEQLCETAMFREPYELVQRKYPKLPQRRVIHEVLRRMIDAQASDLIETSKARILAADPASAEQVRAHPDPLIGFSDNMRERHLELKRFLRKNLYLHYRVHRMTAKAMRTVQALFDVFFDDANLLPGAFQERAKLAEAEHGPSGRARIVADYIAGMTDRYAIAEHGRLFDLKQLT